MSEHIIEAGSRAKAKTVRKKHKITTVIIKANPFDPDEIYSKLAKTEAKYRGYDNEAVPFARNTTYSELARSVLPDRDGNGFHDLYLFETRHQTMIGGEALCMKTMNYMESLSKETPMDILSIASKLVDGRLSVIVLIRPYGDIPDMTTLYDYLGERDESVYDTNSQLIVPDGSIIHYTEEELDRHREAITKQEAVYKDSRSGIPFLNRLDDYEPADLPRFEPGTEPIYDLRSKERAEQTNLPWEKFEDIYVRCKKDIVSTERYQYYEAMQDKKAEEAFLHHLAAIINSNYVKTNILPKEDEKTLYNKLKRALFEYDVLQDLIDNPDVTDIKVTDPYTIRVNIKGSFYLSNVTFLDDMDYERFIVGLSKKNNVDLSRAVRTFTDAQHDENYILRFTVTSAYTSGNNYHVIHIGKQPKNKLMYNDLIKAGMFPPKVGKYLMDRAKHGRGIVIAGPPRSGKTVCMNWLFEDGYEKECEILIIQENDELFPYRTGVTTQHVVLDPPRGYERVTLGDLGEKALVAGCNVFIIGETKGAEIYYALTLANSGCRAAITVHSESAEETMDKMVMLTMLSGFIQSREMAKQMLRAFDTVVYIKGFKIQEIVEVTGYDEEKGELVMRHTYKRNAEPEQSYFPD